MLSACSWPSRSWPTSSASPDRVCGRLRRRTPAGARSGGRCGAKPGPLQSQPGRGRSHQRRWSPARSKRARQSAGVCPRAIHHGAHRTALMPLSRLARAEVGTFGRLPGPCPGTGVLEPGARRMGVPRGWRVFGYRAGSPSWLRANRLGSGSPAQAGWPASRAPRWTSRADQSNLRGVMGLRLGTDVGSARAVSRWP